MLQLLLGTGFILLDLNVEFGSTVLGLLPDTVGYLLLVAAIRRLGPLCPRLRKCELYVGVMIFYSLALYCFDLFGISVKIGVMGMLLSCISCIYCFFILYQCVRSLWELEQQYGLHLKSNVLKLGWLIAAAGNLCTYAAAVIFPQWVTVCTLAGCAGNIYFIIGLYHAYRNFCTSKPMIPPEVRALQDL